MVICKFNKYVYEAKKCCNKNYWESFKCKFNKYIYEAKKCWTCKLQSKFYMQTTTYYVHETTNTRFTFENCGGCLKQIRKKMLGC